VDRNPVPLAKLTIYVPPEVHRALKVEAAERGMTMGEVIIDALQTRIRLLTHPKDGQ